MSIFSENAIRSVKEGALRGEPVRGPFDVQVLPLNLCNQSCIFCPLHSAPESAREAYAPRFGETGQRMEWEVFERIIEGLKGLGDVERVHFTGGEPLLHPRIADMVASFKKSFPASMVGVVTNGALLEKKLDELAEAGADRLSVSINAARASTYLKLCPSNSREDFASLMRGLEKYASLKNRGREHFPELALTAVLTRHNRKQAGKLLDIAAKYGAGSLTFIPLAPFDFDGSSPNAELAPTARQFKKFIRSMQKLSPKASDKGIWMGYTGTPDDNGILRAYEAGKSFKCLAGYSFIVFWPDGSVRPCCNCEAVMGDIMCQSLEQIWHSEAYRRFRAGGAEGNLSEDMKCFCNECGYLYENDLLAEKCGI